MTETGGRTKAATVHYYLHTHWDREWYVPFEGFRTQLLATVRGVLSQLECGNLPAFMLDGQSCILEDILAVDPSLEERIRLLMQSGALSAGPWYVLADQMLVSGESLVRNLKIGLKTTRLFGAPSMVGYCPDTFGHSQDLPRILSGFGISNAVVWRGVPRLKGGPSFWWMSPDGSKVLSYLLEDGYYHASLMQDEQTDVARYIKHKASVCLDGGNSGGAGSDEILIPIGADHMAPDADFMDRINAVEKILNAEKPSVSITLKSVQLQEFLGSRDYAGQRPGTATISGELRENRASLEHGRAYLLQGVLSTRLYLKRRNRIQEHRIIRVVEPFLTVLSWLDLFPYPGAELEHAWKLLLKNHPHDSIGGCSVDPVHREMVTRSSRFHHVLDAVEHQAAGALSAAKAAVRFARTARGELIADPTLDLRYLLVFNLNSDLLDEPVPFSFATMGDVEVKTGLHSLDAECQLQIDESADETVVYTAVGREPLERHVRVHRGWLWCSRCHEHEGLGVKTMQWPVFLDRPQAPAQADAPNAVQIGSNRLTNEYFDLIVDDAGMLAVTLKGAGNQVYRLGHWIRDVGDAGDEYNFDPIANETPAQARLLSVKAGQKGPIVASLELQYEIDIPEAVEANGLLKETAGEQFEVVEYGRSLKLVKHAMATRITLKRGVPIVFFDTAVDNQASDHRLEIVFDTGSPVSTTYSENHFSLVERPVGEKDELPVALGCEAAPDRFPCQRFFIANHQAFFNLGMPEYGAEGNHVTLTGLRAVSKLSRARLRTRGGGAAPALDTPEGNCHGINQLSYGWAPLRASMPGSTPDSEGSLPSGQLCDQMRMQAYRLADLFCGNGIALLAGARRIERDGPWLSVNNQAIRLVSMYAADDRGRIFLRFLNTLTEKQQAVVRVSLPFVRAMRCSLAEEPLADVNRITLDADSSDLILAFGPNELLTLKLDTA